MMGGVKIDALELRRVNLPLVRPFRTSLGTETVREALVIRVLTADGRDGASAWPDLSRSTPRSMSTAPG